MADTVTELSSAERKLDEQIHRAKRQQMTSIVVGVILLIVVIAYLSWMSGQVREITSDPSGAAGVVSDQIVARLPEVRQTVTREVRSNLPKMLDEGVTSLIKEGLPEGRKAVEKQVEQFLSEKLKESEEVLKTSIDETLEMHGPQIRELLEHIDTPEGQKAFEDALYGMIEESLASEQIKVELDGYAMALNEINQRLDYFIQTPQTEMGEEEQMLFELIATLREMAKRHRITDVTAKDVLSATGTE